MTLSEFLLARINDDARVAEQALQHTDRSHADPTGDLKALTTVGEYGVVQPALRARDEWEAKKRVIEAYSRVPHPTDDRYSSGWHDATLFAMRSMAEVYASHEDYDPSWQVDR